MIPCYKRHEYTEKCLEALYHAQTYDDVKFYIVNDGSVDNTTANIRKSDLYIDYDVTFIDNEQNKGLRQVIIDFFDYLKTINVEYVFKVDNDCLVPNHWLNDIVEALDNVDASILSPNVYPSNAAFKHGSDDVHMKGYRPADTVGGLWMMRYNLIRDMIFEKYDELSGLKGAVPILRQIVNENNPKIGWLPTVTFQDVGHWSGEHPKCLRTQDHYEYSQEVGRNVAWA